jgi:uncharacterized protein (TIGR02145 family)
MKVMKKSTVIIFFLFIVLKFQAQDYLISFEGAGDTTAVNTIKVDNLTSGITVTLAGTDILHLFAPVGIRSLNPDHETLQIAPNPMEKQAMMTFIAPENGNVVICIYDLSGKTVYRFSKFLLSGTHSFRVSGIRRGIYFVKVTGNSYKYSTKLISQNTLQSETRIEDVSSMESTSSNLLKNIVTTIDMPYTAGDVLLYKGISGQYSTLVTDRPYSSKTVTFNFVLCKDKDGNDYTIVKIDNQTWMAENLRTTHYQNGDSIPNITDNDDWHGLTTGAFCWYDNDETSYKILYGALYNWYAVKDSRNLCPPGWLSPTDDEWTTLTNYLGNLSIAGGKMKTTGTLEAGTGLWSEPNSGATNEMGFSALPAGTRDSNGIFNYVSYDTNWWSATQSSTNYAWYRHVSYDEASVSRGNLSKTFGYSLRCLRN